MLLSDVLIVPNLAIQPLYKALHFILDGGCDNGIDHATGRCPHLPNLITLALFKA
jgi:hypothetical protein